MNNVQRLETCLLASANLEGDRQLTCYRSPAFDRSHKKFLLIGFDGECVPALTNLLIKSEHCRDLPFALVGIHSHSVWRSKEYLEGNDPVIFTAHERFTINEVLSWAAQRFRVSLSRQQTGIFGVSNGATLAMHLGIKYHEQFGSIIAFSPAGGSERTAKTAFKVTPFPKIYLAAGNRETPFRNTVKRYHALLTQHQVEHRCVIRDNATHDLSFWARELPLALAWAIDL